VPKKAIREEVHDDIRNIFNMPTKEAAERLLKLSAAKHRETASDLSAWMKSGQPICGGKKYIRLYRDGKPLRAAKV